MQVKKSIKKVGAVAGSALMVGMTFGAAAPLADFPQPFVDDNGQVQSQIVVGSQGKVADVVGAIDIGAATGQAAVQTTEKTVPGAESADVDGETYEPEVRQTLDNGWIDKSAYSELARETVQDKDGNDVRVLERAQADFSTGVNGTETLVSVNEDAVQYEVSYSPGFAVGDNIPVLGNDYEVTAITDDGNGNPQVNLGSKRDEDNLHLGDTYDHGPYTVEVIDKDEANSAIYVEVSKDGNVLKSQGLSTESGGDNDMVVDDGAFELVADQVFFGSKSDYIDVHSVHTDTQVVQGEDSPFDADYTVSSVSGSNFTSAHPDSGTVSGLTLQNNLYTTTQNPSETDAENDINRVGADGQFAGPAGYFNLNHLGLDSQARDDLTVKENYMVSFTDTLGIDQTVDASKADYGFDGATSGNLTRGDGAYHVDVNDRPFTVSFNNVGSILQTDASSGSIDVTASYEGFSESGTASFSALSDGGADGTTTTSASSVIDVDSGYGAYVQLDVTAADTDDDGVANADEIRVTIDDGSGDNTDLALNTEFDNTVSWTTAGTLDAVQVGEVDSDTESTVSTVNASYNGDGTLAHVGDNGVGDWTLTSGGQNTLSKMGSTVSTGSDFQRAELSVPEEQRLAQVALGSTETTSGSDQTYRAVDASAQGNLPSMAMLDSQVQESHKTNNHLILVGGPAVNTLVADLVNEGAVDLSKLEGQSSGALVQGVSDAFAEGQDALVVAGVKAADTRSASQYVANYASHQERLSNAGDSLVLKEADYPTSGQ